MSIYNQKSKKATNNNKNSKTNLALTIPSKKGKEMLKKKFKMRVKNYSKNNSNKKFNY